MGSAVLTQATQGHEKFTGGEVLGGGAIGSTAKWRFQGHSGEGSVRTASESMRRCGRRGRRRRGGSDGAGDEEERRSVVLLQTRNAAKPRGERRSGLRGWDEMEEAHPVLPFIGAGEERGRRSWARGRGGGGWDPVKPRVREGEKVGARVVGDAGSCARASGSWERLARAVGGAPTGRQWRAVRRVRKKGGGKEKLRRGSRGTEGAGELGWLGPARMRTVTGRVRFGPKEI